MNGKAWFWAALALAGSAEAQVPVSTRCFPDPSELSVRIFTAPYTTHGPLKRSLPSMFPLGPMVQTCVDITMPHAPANQPQPAPASKLAPKYITAHVHMSHGLSLHAIKSAHALRCKAEQLYMLQPSIASALQCQSRLAQRS